MQAFKQLFEDVRKCKLAKTCPGRDVRQFYFENEGSALNYPVIFVCETPATALGYGDGSIRQTCWTGRGPDLHFREMMKMVKMDGALITNVIKCGAKVAQVPSEKQITTCMRFLRREIELVKPRVLVCVGQKALRYCHEYLNLSIPLHYVPHYSWTLRPNYDFAKERHAYLAIKAYLK